MRKLLFVLVMLFLCIYLFGQTYYSRGSSSSYYLNNLSSWSTNRDGSGAQPTSFSGAGKYFVVQNAHTLTATSQWSVINGALVWVESGGKIITGPYDHAITGKVFNGGSYEVTHTSYSNLGWGGVGELEPNSNFILNNADINFNDNVSYGNLIVQSGEAECRGSTTGFEIKGELRVKAGGIWDGGLTMDQIHYIGNIYMDGGTFYGSNGSANVTYNLSGNLTIGLGYFYGSNGSGACTYNIGGNLLHQNGWFYGTFRSSGALPYNTFNIAGNFTRTGGSYHAVNRVDAGYPSFYLSGTGKNLGFGSVSNRNHYIEIMPGASYSLTNGISFDAGMMLYVRGTLNAGTNQVTAYGTGCTFRVFGLLQTAKPQGLSGSTLTTFSSYNDPVISLWPGCTVEYTAGSDQTVTPRTDYQDLKFSGDGTKFLYADASVAGLTTVNAPLLIDLGCTLTLNGALSATHIIEGGNLTVSGNSAQLELTACNLDYLTIARTLGCSLAGPVLVRYYVNLNSGTLYLANQTLTLQGMFQGTGGSVLGSPQAGLTVIGDYATTLALPASISELGNLELDRPSGCNQQGNLAVGTLDLNSGSLSVGSHTLTLNGALNLNGGTLNAASASTISIQGTGYDINLPVTQLAGLIMNRSGYTCHLSGNTEVASLGLDSGILDIGANTLTASFRVTAQTAAALQGSGSTLILTPNVIQASIPGGYLYCLEQLCPVEVGLMGNLYLQWLNLASGILNLGDNYLTLQSGFQQGTVIPNTGIIRGSASSGLNLVSSENTGPWTIPETIVGTLNIHLASGCVIGGETDLLSSLALMNGEVDPSGNLRIADNALIIRDQGFLSGPASLGNQLRLIYLATCETGFELPSWPDLQAYQITVEGFQSVVTFNSDAGLFQSLFIAPECVLDITGHTLYCEPQANLMGEGLFFGHCSIPGVITGFNATVAGLILHQSTFVEDFAFRHLPDTQQLINTQSIARTWSLDGTFDGIVNLTLSWDQSADNGLGFAPDNPAFVYKNADGIWDPFAGPFFVSEMQPRSVSFTTESFSQWTASMLNLRAPVVSIERSLNDAIKLNWAEVNFAEAYEIWRSEDPCDGYIFIDQIPGLEYTDPEPVAKAFYWVKAVSAF